MTEKEVEPHERPFDPSKVPLEDAARDLTAAFIALVERSESRTRARRPADLGRFRRAASALALDLAHSHLTDPKAWLFVKMSKWAYAPAERGPVEFLQESVPDFIRNLAEYGLIDLRKGFQGEFGSGRRTTIRAGRPVVDLIVQSGVTIGGIGRDPELLGDSLSLKSVRVEGRKAQPFGVTRI